MTILAWTIPDWQSWQLILSFSTSKVVEYICIHLPSQAKLCTFFCYSNCSESLQGHTAPTTEQSYPSCNKNLSSAAAQRVPLRAAWAHSPAPTNNPLLHNLISLKAARSALPHATIPLAVPQPGCDSRKEEILPGALLKASLPKPKTGSVNIKASSLVSNLSWD